MATINNLLVENLHRTSISKDVNSGDRTIQVVDASGFPNPNEANAEYFYATILDSNNHMEILKIVKVSTDGLLSLSTDSTIHYNYSTMDGRVETWFVAEIIQDIQDFLDDIQEVTADELTIHKSNNVFSLKSVPPDMIESGVALSKLSPISGQRLIGNTGSDDNAPSEVVLSGDTTLSDNGSGPATQAAIKQYVDTNIGGGLTYDNDTLKTNDEGALAVSRVPTDTIDDGIELSKLETVNPYMLLGNVTADAKVPYPVALMDVMLDVPSPAKSSTIKTYVDGAVSTAIIPLNRIDQINPHTLLANTTDEKMAPVETTISDDLQNTDNDNCPAAQSAIRTYIDDHTSIGQLRAVMGNVVNNHITGTAFYDNSSDNYTLYGLDLTKTAITKVEDGNWIKVDIGLSMSVYHNAVFILQVSTDDGDTWDNITIEPEDPEDKRTYGLFPAPSSSDDAKHTMGLYTYSYIDTATYSPGAVITYRVAVSAEGDWWALNRTKNDGSSSSGYERATSYVHLSEIPK